VIRQFGLFSGFRLENMNMKKYLFFTVLFGVMVFIGCKKSPDYVPEPYACKCGSLTWFGTEYQVLDANYIHPSGFDSRRYYITTKVDLPEEMGTHTMNTWIEIPDVTTSITHQINPNDTLFEFTALVDEFNVNDPLDTLRKYIPVQGVITINPPAIFGGPETVQFLLILNELSNGIPGGANIQYKGSFTVNIEAN
jgi:hypothetical protein